jgi:hypothetical protein
LIDVDLAKLGSVKGFPSGTCLTTPNGNVVSGPIPIVANDECGQRLARLINTFRFNVKKERA